MRRQNPGQIRISWKIVPELFLSGGTGVTIHRQQLSEGTNIHLRRGGLPYLPPRLVVAVIKSDMWKWPNSPNSYNSPKQFTKMTQSTQFICDLKFRLVLEVFLFNIVKTGRKKRSWRISWRGWGSARAEEVCGIIIVEEELDNILRMSLLPRAAPDDE